MIIVQIHAFFIPAVLKLELIDLLTYLRSIPALFPMMQTFCTQCDSIADR